ncbi:MAG: Crp/Fnr family transcriptional regulator [Verrucomicrobia bacterium]|nr:Crp/Fnr family transcriptional regulator [Verrucomicrobiota bacterium]
MTSEKLPLQIYRKVLAIDKIRFVREASLASLSMIKRETLLKMLNTFNNLTYKRATAAINLKKCEAFAGLPQEDLQKIVEFTAVKFLEKGECLFREGDKANNFYVVGKGAISLFRTHVSGRERVLHIYRAGESITLASLWPCKEYSADAQALESTKVLLVKKHEMMEILKRHPEQLFRFFSSMCNNCRTILEMIEDAATQDVETRLLNWLLKRCPSQGADDRVAVPLGMTKRNWAAELGTISETLSRTLGKFRKEGLIEVNRQTITVLSPARLTNRINSNSE